MRSDIASFFNLSFVIEENLQSWHKRRKWRFLTSKPAVVIHSVYAYSHSFSEIVSCISVFVLDPSVVADGVVEGL